MARIGGIAYVKYDGRQLPLRGNFTVSPSKTERTGVAGLDGVHGYTESPRVPYIEGDVSTTEDVSVEEIDAIENATVTAELANGKTYVLRQAYTKSAIEINAHDGSMKVRFEGMSCDEF
jgi:hypothetical protein